VGTPLKPNEPANDCTVCWGTGKPFGDGPTPRVIVARFTSFLPGEYFVPEQEQLLLTSHWLEQTAIHCIYQIDDGIFVWTVDWRVDSTQFRIIRNSDGKMAFFAHWAPVCAVDYPNEFDHPGNVIAYNGFINITWDLEGLE